MNRNPPQLHISTSPFVTEGSTTGNLMRQVIYALIPVLIAALWFFGITALLVVGAACLGAMGTEWLLRDKQTPNTLPDGSALLTGLLLGLTLPPAIPLWMAALGGFIAIALGKVIWGGLGSNLFNPALLGRAFLQAAFPEAMTTWVAPGKSFFSLYPTTLAPPLFKADVTVDSFSSATPLGMIKFDEQLTALDHLLIGNIGGSLGETSAGLLVICGLVLAFRKVFDWRAPLATLLSVVACSFLLSWIFGTPEPGFMLLSGGLLFGAVFMVTDPVTTPITPKGQWIFGLGLGFLIVVIRIYGGLPECVMFTILFMNALTPLINRHTQPRPFGG
ncbi:MAG: RnfABCDGE type electron transport complex subunit D [Acidobacteriota bacterium]|nr:RnfABCDGE type electron transport complex subunit D [Acidobacteriota bacterium]